MTVRVTASRPRHDVPAAWPLLIVLCVTSTLIVVILGTRLTFFNDDWYFLLQRPGLESGAGLDALLAPHNGNIVVLLALLYKLLVAIFGFGSQLPFRLVLGLTMACLGVLVFVLVRKRLGPVVGLAAAAVVLFLGPAWEVLLFFASFSHLGALTLGVAALLALEIDTPRRNASACALLVCATLLFNLGIPFVVGAAIAIAIALRRRPAQLWIAGLPAALFALWWALYGSKQPSGLSLRNVEHLPRYVFDSVSSGLTSVTGLNHGAALGRGHVLAVICAVAIVVWLLRRGRPDAWLLVLAGTALSFWALSGAGYVPGREPDASRYQLTDDVLLILLAAELLGGVHLPRAALGALSVATVLVVASNLDSLSNGFTFMRQHSDYVRADLGALEIARPLAPSGLWLRQPVARDPYLSGVTAGRYFAQTRVHGSAAFYTATQLASGAPEDRQAADSVLAAAYRITPRPTSAQRPSGACRSLAAAVTPVGPSLPLTDGSNMLRNLSAVALVIGVRRFAPSGLPVYVGFMAPRSSARIDIPRDSLALPWRVSIRNPSGARGISVKLCGAS